MTGSERVTAAAWLAAPVEGVLAGVDVGEAEDLADGAADIATLAVGLTAADGGEAAVGIAVVGPVTRSWSPVSPSVKNPAPMSSSTAAATHQRLELRIIPAMRLLSAGEAGIVIQLQKLRRRPCREHPPE